MEAILLLDVLSEITAEEATVKASAKYDYGDEDDVKSNF